MSVTLEALHIEHGRLFVHIVMRSDGNVCCPSDEFDSVWSTSEQADRRVSILKSAGTSAHTFEMQVDGDIVGL